MLSAMAVAPLVHLRGQQEPTFSAGVKVVNVFATVRDRRGQVVRNLTKDDFLLDEDGRPQMIRYFSQESNLPLTIGLLIDTSGSTRNVLADERSASFRFLRQVMRQEKDLAFIIHFDFETELLQDLTSSQQLLEKALDALEPAGLQRRTNGGPWGYPGGRGRRGGRGGGRRITGGGTVLYDAVYLASVELMKKQSGRKALIVLSDGEDNGSKETLMNAVESAQRTDTLVYSILFEDPYTDLRLNRGRLGRGPDGRQVLDRISRETGGRLFEVSRRMPIEKVFAAIEEDLRNQYSLGYSPEGSDTAGGYRRIRVTTKQKGLIVQTREGYYPS